MVLITNVLVNVKAILDIATVTIKIHAPVVPLVHLAQLALMEITAQMDAKAKLDRKVVVKDSNVHQDLLDVKNALMDPKDQTDPLDLLDQLARKEVLAEKVEMVNPADPVQLVAKVMQARLAVMAKLVPAAILAKTPKVAPKVPRELKEIKARLDQLEPMAKKEEQANQAQLVLLVQPEVLAKVAKMEEKDPLAQKAQLEDPARMPNTVHAPVVPRKHKEPQHRINPITIIGQDGFDNDNNQYFPNNLKLIVSIMIFIYNRIMVNHPLHRSGQPLHSIYM